MKESFVINGLGGEHTLKGEIPVRGAKNDALKILAAAGDWTFEVGRPKCVVFVKLKNSARHCA